MSPFRWDVLLVGFVLAVPVLALGLRGDFSTEEMVSRLPWCLLAGWVVVALVRAVAAPPKPAPKRRRRPAARPTPAEGPEPG
ncbi:hypothetical protein QOZ88_17015 [Blastococcus sp. BMG 814]|uniref:DUF2842 domain-containing protein n=1 Tax=Blastococcus carthaginiensis TaxID=3050034 RepID=A0ABT9IFJ8_9ACTN|nr:MULTISPECIES: hypothetical protein [Blastococcus]MDP5184338.1 hypothetical protein [Blastococcus carthaginiensis]SEL18907.1 hypothetical protein SAMN04515665_10990 [Blastococcus sp. DSM 46786]